MSETFATIDGNEAAAMVAHKLNEVIAIYPITPASPMGEWADLWSSQGRKNLWGAVPLVVEMQAESGAAGAVHGSLQAGALTTTFTASQGLLLMIPNLYKIAGELTPAVIHVAARSVAAQALSIFGDHSDVMAARQTGFALLASGSVQEVHDFAAIAQASTLKARLPFLHFFDGFRTSHEVNKLRLLSDDVLSKLIDDELIEAHRERALNPDRPFIRGTAQNPDVFFQARETVNPYYAACPSIVQDVMDQFADLTGRSYHLFDYVGAEDAQRVIVMMGSGSETAEETIQYLAGQGEKVGLIKVRLYRPFDSVAFVNSLPASVRSVAVLDRTKEPGSAGEPLYLDVVTALADILPSGQAALKSMPVVIGGRYGLSSKEFTPAMVKAVLDELTQDVPKNHFTVGITDDVSHTSLTVDSSFSIEHPDTVRAVFYGLGSDGTVSANKNSIKIIGTETPSYAQGFFVYDSKKSGAMTTSHLRFGKNPIKSTYLLDSANFVACHQFDFLTRYDVLRLAEPGATFLLNSPFGPEEVWDHLPVSVQEAILSKGLKFFVIDGYSVADEAGMGRRINTVMQTCFFALSGVLPKDEAIAQIKKAIKKSYGKRGETVVNQNFAAVDAALAHLHEIKVPEGATSTFDRQPVVPNTAPAFVRDVTGKMIAKEGDSIPVSALPADGTYPSGTSRWEKRNITDEIPVWEKELCIQCGKCVFVCPHAAIRQKVYDPELLSEAPSTFLSSPARFKEFKDMVYTLQVAPEDCTGCTLCVDACPVKDKANPTRKAINMVPQRPIREVERENWAYFLDLPEIDRSLIPVNQVKYSQLLQPLFEFSGACSGCGETPYLKLLSQLFGERAYVANATGCSSIYGGNLPTTPWTYNREGRGPAWSNSLFEDNAEFGFGMRVALDQRLQMATQLLEGQKDGLDAALVDAILDGVNAKGSDVEAQRKRVEELKGALKKSKSVEARRLAKLADIFVPKTVWIVGGDGWAYDIGYGGLDHVLASGRDVNILVMDTEVYSNTGGQKSKATPRGAVAKFAAGGKSRPKKDLGLLAMSYKDVYVARVAFGADDAQTIKAFVEAEAYPGPSLIVAYSHCIEHGFDLSHGLSQQKAAVASGYWPLYRYVPERVQEGLAPLIIDSKAPSLPLEDYMYKETRFNSLRQSHPEAAAELLAEAKADVEASWEAYERLAREPEPA
jgi:pyruvate-ferredoxin/flavodoxin oxidoreductase